MTSTNGLFDTSNEMNYIITRRKPFYLVRMLAPGLEWAEPATSMAFPPSIMYKVRAHLHACFTPHLLSTHHVLIAAFQGTGSYEPGHTQVGRASPVPPPPAPR